MIIFNQFFSNFDEHHSWRTGLKEAVLGHYIFVWENKIFVDNSLCGLHLQIRIWIFVEK